MLQSTPGADHEEVRPTQCAPVVELRQIAKHFDDTRSATVVLHDISLAIRPHEYVAIQGPSGSGKSTLLSIVGLLELPSAGEYLLNGTDTAHLSTRERARLRNVHIGFVFQAFHLLDELTVYENVELPLLYRQMPRRERRERVLRALERVAMELQQHYYPGQLSGGQQQRVAVARAIAGTPALVLADEPTGNLDSANAESVMQLLSELRADGATVCLVTHDPRFACGADRIVRLLDGRVTGAV